MNPILLSTLFLTQIVLWTAYLYQLQGNNLSKYWGNVPKSMWFYLLGSAAVAYVLNLYLVTTLSFRHFDPSLSYSLAAATAMYYIMQMLFLPWVNHTVNNRGSRWPVRLLLLVCIVPIAITASIGVQRGFYVSAIGPLAHVVINDALLYGFLF